MGANAVRTRGSAESKSHGFAPFAIAPTGTWKRNFTMIGKEPIKNK